VQRVYRVEHAGENPARPAGPSMADTDRQSTRGPWVHGPWPTAAPHATSTTALAALLALATPWLLALCPSARPHVDTLADCLLTTY
jgi:hypothetical protein